MVSRKNYIQKLLFSNGMHNLTPQNTAEDQE